MKKVPAREKNVGESLYYKVYLPAKHFLFISRWKSLRNRKKLEPLPSGSWQDLLRHYNNFHKHWKLILKFQYHNPKNGVGGSILRRRGGMCVLKRRMDIELIMSAQCATWTHSYLIAFSSFLSPYSSILCLPSSYFISKRFAVVSPALLSPK